LFVTYRDKPSQKAFSLSLLHEMMKNRRKSQAEKILLPPKEKKSFPLNFLSKS